MQPNEFYDLWDGYIWRHEQEENMMAYFTACQMSVHTKRPVSPADLLKPLRKNKDKRNKKADKEYLKEKFKDILK